MDVNSYYRQLAALLPPGLPFDVDAQPELSELVTKMAAELAAVHWLEESIVAETDPRDAFFLLPEWEASFGLPDECSAGSQILQERRAAVYAKISDLGGARRIRYLKLLADLGINNANIERFDLHTCEHTCEYEVRDDVQWRHTWRVHLPDAIKIQESTCESSCEEALRTWGNTMAECVISRENAAISNVLFAYH